MERIIYLFSLAIYICLLLYVSKMRVIPIVKSKYKKKYRDKCRYLNTINLLECELQDDEFSLFYYKFKSHIVIIILHGISVFFFVLLFYNKILKISDVFFWEKVLYLLSYVFFLIIYVLIVRMKYKEFDNVKEYLAKIEAVCIDNKIVRIITPHNTRTKTYYLIIYAVNKEGVPGIYTVRATKKMYYKVLEEHKCYAIFYKSKFIDIVGNYSPITATI